MLDHNRLAVFLSPHDEPARLLLAANSEQRLPLAIVLGGDPRTLLSVACAAASGNRPGRTGGRVAGTAAGDGQMPQHRVGSAGRRRDRPGRLHRSAGSQVKAGPRCTPLGQLAPARLEPVMHVTTVTHRANPVFPAMVYGRPPHEGALIHRAMWQVLLPLLKSSIAELADLDLPMFGAAGIGPLRRSIRLTPGRLARWPMRCGASAAVVCQDHGAGRRSVDVHDLSGVLEAVATHVDPGRDVLVAHGPPDPLDVATPPEQLAQPMAIDATVKLPEEQGGYWPAAAKTTDEIERLVSERWVEYQLGPEPKGR